MASRERTEHWKRWGPYLSERGWGTVREDYSTHGEAWEYLPHDHARSRAYRWNEDGLGGISDRHGLICFALSLWNGADPFLKERLFGLTGNQGNHGEDVKEYYYYLDSTPTHSWMKFLYKYPQRRFPYEDLLHVNAERGRDVGEYELVDTGAFDENRYFDVTVEYAKGDADDILVRITAANRGPDMAMIDLVPTVWFRNTWSWGRNQERPVLRRFTSTGGAGVELHHSDYGARRLYCNGAPELLFTENETNSERLYGAPNGTPYVKDGINDYIVDGNERSVNPEDIGTKAGARYQLAIPAGEERSIELRLTNRTFTANDLPFGKAFEKLMELRRVEADAFFATVIPKDLSDDGANVMRQSLAGLLWSKQYYHYVINEWIEGDPAFPSPPEQRQSGRNFAWTHLHNADVISMPDKWEYPWYAAWDLAFHCVPLAIVDSDFAKEQLVLLLREWYMHPNGQLPAYEWALGDVNPPVHAWAAWRVYKIEQKRRGKGDTEFLERVFHKLLLNFTWWVNRKDADGRNIFQGGFLGLDNIGVFDRSAPLPTGGYLEQSDGTSWMAMYSLNMLAIALELAGGNPAYEDVASKFWEHFIHIAGAMNDRGSVGVDMWNKEDGFFYDVLHCPNGSHFPITIRSMVGLIPLFAVETLEPEMLDRLPNFRRRLEWFIDNRPDIISGVACMRTPGSGERRLLSIVDRDQLRRVLQRMLDETEFLSDYGIRALSQKHRDEPYRLEVGGATYRVDYEPGESSTGLFGGNSNWRGPIWFPVNYLIIESLQKFHHYLGDDYTVECPTGSGVMMNLWEVAAEISRRLSRIFLRNENGERPVFGSHPLFNSDPHWRDLVLFHEYFHGDTGLGIGASHQTGWTALVAKLLQQNREKTSEGEKTNEGKTVTAEPLNVATANGNGVVA